MPSVLITGASKGIGRATAIEFANRGYHVIATARDPRTLEDLPVAERLRLDVTDQQSVDDAIQAAGDIDVLVSNAGLIFNAAVEASPIDEIERVFAANTFGAIRVAQAVLPQMRQRRGGRLLFLSSVLGRVALSGNGAYAASKWALEALVESLAIETSPFGITSALLEPGFVSSGALDDPQRYSLADDPYAGQLATDQEPAGVITPEAVATTIADAADAESLPFRIPVGDTAAWLLGARKDAPEDAPFVPGA
jgi:NAD(P)-dependent dehydrogenase (short-subunit alcohol dehydrogenase family)